MADWTTSKQINEYYAAAGRLCSPPSALPIKVIWYQGNYPCREGKDVGSFTIPNRRQLAVLAEDLAAVLGAAKDKERDISVGIFFHHFSKVKKETEEAVVLAFKEEILQALRRLPDDFWLKAVAMGWTRQEAWDFLDIFSEPVEEPAFAALPIFLPNPEITDNIITREFYSLHCLSYGKPKDNKFDVVYYLPMDDGNYSDLVGHQYRLIAAAADWAKRDLRIVASADIFNDDLQKEVRDKKFVPMKESQCYRPWEGNRRFLQKLCGYAWDRTRGSAAGSFEFHETPLRSIFDRRSLILEEYRDENGKLPRDARGDELSVGPEECFLRAVLESEMFRAKDDTRYILYREVGLKELFEGAYGGGLGGQEEREARLKAVDEEWEDEYGTGALESFVCDSPARLDFVLCRQSDGAILAVIEVDGGYHADPAQQLRDAKKDLFMTRVLQREGSVLRGNTRIRLEKGDGGWQDVNQWLAAQKGAFAYLRLPVDGSTFWETEAIAPPKPGLLWDTLFPHYGDIFCEAPESYFDPDDPNSVEALPPDERRRRLLRSNTLTLEDLVDHWKAKDDHICFKPKSLNKARDALAKGELSAWAGEEELKTKPQGSTDWKGLAWLLEHLGLGYVHKCEYDMGGPLLGEDRGKKGGNTYIVEMNEKQKGRKPALIYGIGFNGKNTYVSLYCTDEVQKTLVQPLKDYFTKKHPGE